MRRSFVTAFLAGTLSIAGMGGLAATIASAPAVAGDSAPATADTTESKAATRSVAPAATDTATSETPYGPGASCTTSRNVLARTSVDSSRAASGTVRIGGRDINFRALKWQLDTPSDPTIAAVFHSSAWVTSLLTHAPDTAVDLLLEQARVRPDTGAADRDARIRNGWSESNVTKRMWAVMCVLGRTHDNRLVPILEQLAAANLDPARYYGPPNRHVHNHGTFANEALLAAASVLGRDDWADAAAKRLALALDETFETCGMTYEQSATYQLLNVRQWQRILESVPGLRDETNSLQRARNALSALARPDGQIEPIGDGSWGTVTADALERVDAQPGGTVWCPETGWWAEHQDGAGQNHIVARFGPKARLHGDQDHTSLTWWVGGADGVAVLSERGMHSKALDRHHDYVNSPAAHNLLERVGAPFKGPTTGTRTNSNGMNGARLVTKQDDGTRSRSISLNPNAPVLTVTDTVSGSRAGRGYVQHWQLAPEWKPARDHTAQTGNGDTLDIVCLVNGKKTAVVLEKATWYPRGGETGKAYTARCQAGAASNVRFDTVLVVNGGNVTVDGTRVNTRHGRYTAGTAGWALS